MSLKNQMEPELGVPIRIRAGTPGSLVVLLDGQPIYSKKKAAHPPNAAELIQTIRSKNADMI